MSESDLIFTLLVIIFLMQVWNGAPRREPPTVEYEPLQRGSYVHPAQRI